MISYYYWPFQSAISIFSTNDLKYHVNKARAIQWAVAASVPLHYAVARDMASSTVLQEKADVQRSKIEWLQRHDQECGGLYGLLPICLSLPVRATDHLDRRRGILKGCKGKIVGWSAAPHAHIWNKLPDVIYVQFDTAAKWRIDGLLRDNVYPVTAQRKPWFLDRGRKSPRLRITRLQFPLAPGFAITAHVAQGQTLRDGVIADFNISNVASVFTTYVAATRVTGRDKLLIMRPFPASPFQKGNSIGRELLLRVWRGDQVDWEALRAKYLEERLCGECGENKGKAAFTVGQWNRRDGPRACRECTARHRDAGEPYQCSICRLWFSEEAFPMKQRRNANSFYRVCHACELRKPCYICHIKKAESEYSASAWRSRHADRRVCTACANTKKAKGYWTCAACQRSVSQLNFTMWCCRRPSGRDGTQVCDECYRAHALKRIAERARGRLRECRRQLRRRAIMDEVRREISAMVRARGRQPQHREADVPSHSHPQTVTSRKKFQPSLASRSQTADSRKRPRNDTTDEPPKKRRAPLQRSGSLGVVPGRAKIEYHKLVAQEQEQKQSIIPPGERSQGHEQVLGPQNGQATERTEYECPYCQEKTYSSVWTGKVHARGHCGKEFRVRNGVVVRAFTHACPKCGTEVQSAKAAGKIQSKHKTPKGKTCGTTAWIRK